MMDWRDSGHEGGGGYFNESDANTPTGKSGTKSAVRQQFLCPVTIRQVHEAPDDGLKIGNFTATMVTLVGIVCDIDISSTKIKFTLSDDTGEIECIEWLESDEGEQSKNENQMMENTYYQIFGCIKSLQGQRRIMVFKACKIQNFNEYIAFMAEVISVNQYAEKMNQPQIPKTTLNTETNFNSYTSRLGIQEGSFTDNRNAFSPIQQAVLDEIKATEDQIGWSRKTSALNSKFPKKAIEDALEFLISEGHIYTTVDDDHYCST